MRVHNNEPAIIFSAYQHDMPRNINEANHCEIVAFLRKWNVPFRQLTGMYKGRVEKSVMIPACKRRIAITFGHLYHQESILELDNERGATFTELKTGEKHFAGWLKAVSKEAAMKDEGWTKDEGGQYWTISNVGLGKHFER